jgi:hypothetical protein
MRTLTTYEQWDLWLQIAAKGFPRPEDDDTPPGAGGSDASD